MSSVLICSMPAVGHVTPLLSVVRALMESGDRVRMMTGERFRGAVEAAGAEFLPLPPESDFDMDNLEPSGLTGPPAPSFCRCRRRATSTWTTSSRADSPALQRFART